MNHPNILPILPINIFQLPGKEEELFLERNEFINTIKNNDKSLFLVPYQTDDEKHIGNIVEIIEQKEDIEKKTLSIKFVVRALCNNIITLPDSKAQYDLLDIDDAEASEKLLTIYTQYLTISNAKNVNASNYKNLTLLSIASKISITSTDAYLLNQSVSIQEFENKLIQLIYFLIIIEKKSQTISFRRVLN